MEEITLGEMQSLVERKVDEERCGRGNWRVEVFSYYCQKWNLLDCQFAKTKSRNIESSLHIACCLFFFAQHSVAKQFCFNQQIAALGQMGNSRSITYRLVSVWYNPTKHLPK